jgi:hypothetical protein
LLSEGKSLDATVLTIEFECTINNPGEISLDYVFGSFEYRSLAPNKIATTNDVMGIFLNGKGANNNIATVKNDAVVSINNIMVGDELYLNNTKNQIGNAGAVPPYLTGYTKNLVAKGKSTRKAHTIHIAISDIHDDSVDSFLFVRANSLKCKKAGPVVSGPTSSPAPTASIRPISGSGSGSGCVEMRQPCSKSKDCCKGRVCSSRKKNMGICQKCADLKDHCDSDKDCCGKAECDKKTSVCTDPCLRKGKKCDKDKACCSGKCKGKMNKPKCK